MKLRLITTIATAAVLAVGLSACSTLDIGKVASAINQADSGPCFKDIDVQVSSMLIPVVGIVLPVINKANFRKICNAQQAPAPAPAAAAAAAVQVGALIQ